MTHMLRETQTWDVELWPEMWNLVEHLKVYQGMIFMTGQPAPPGHVPPQK